MPGYITAVKVAKAGLAIMAVVLTQLPGCLSCNTLDQVTAPGPGVTILPPPGLSTFFVEEEKVTVPVAIPGQPMTFKLVDQGIGPGKPCPQMVTWLVYNEAGGSSTQVDRKDVASPPTHRLANGDCVVGTAAAPLTITHTFQPGDSYGQIYVELSANGDLDRNDGSLVLKVPDTAPAPQASPQPQSGPTTTSQSTNHAPTDLDPSFGTNGTRLFPSGTSPTSVSDVGQQSNGKLVVFGQFDCPGCPNNPTPFHDLQRLNADGTVDTSGTFNNGNLSPSGFFNPQKLLITPGDGILTVGDDHAGPGLTFTHFNSSGNQDASSSLALTGSPQIFAAVRQPSGKIDLVGYTFNSSAGVNTGLIVQLTSAYALDTGFGGSNHGYITFQATVNMAAANTLFFAAATQSNNQIIVGGSAGPAASSDGLVAAFNGTTGAPVSGFGTGGTVLQPPPSGGSASVGAVLTDSADRIVAATIENNSTNTTGIAFSRLTLSGAQDGTFPTPTVSVPSGYSFFPWAGGMGIDPAGNLVLGGGARGNNGGGLASPYMVRLTPSAAPDNGFGTNGAFVDSFSGATVNTFAIQSDGKYLIGGATSQGYLRRYFGAFGESSSPNVFGSVSRRGAHVTARSAATRHRARSRARTITASGQLVGRTGSIGTPGYMANGNGVLRGASGSAKLDARITTKRSGLRGLPVQRLKRLMHVTLFAKGDITRYFAPPIGNPVLMTGMGVAQYPRGHTVGCFQVTATPPSGSNAGSQHLTLLGGTGAAKGLRVTVQFPPLSIDRGVGSPKPGSLKLHVSKHGLQHLTPACAALLKQAPTR